MTGEASRLRIRLPEGVTLSLTLAGPMTRIIAYFADLSVISALSAAAGYVLSVFVAWDRDLGGALFVLTYFAIAAGYGIACEYGWNGQTLGKWLLGLRVMDSGGLELEFGQIALRNILRIVDLLPFFGLVGGIAICLNQRRQRLGDMAAGTIVVVSRRRESPDVDAVARGRYNSFLAHQVECGRLRQRATPEAAAVAFEALLRRDALEDRARVERFDELAAHFAALVEFPAEETEALTSEQYVRNVVEILYSRPRKSAAAPPLKLPAAVDEADAHGATG